MSEARIDKWLWAARIFKTRSMAAAACKKGQVSMNGAQLKPSRTVKPGDIVRIKVARDKNGRWVLAKIKKLSK